MADWVTSELLQTLLDRHGAAMELFASQWTKAPEDCVQDAFIQLFVNHDHRTALLPGCFAWCVTGPSA